MRGRPPQKPAECGGYRDQAEGLCCQVFRGLELITERYGSPSWTRFELLSRTRSCRSGSLHYGSRALSRPGTVLALALLVTSRAPSCVLVRRAAKRGTIGDAQLVRNRTRTLKGRFQGVAERANWLCFQCAPGAIIHAVPACFPGSLARRKHASRRSAATDAARRLSPPRVPCGRVATGGGRLAPWTGRRRRARPWEIQPRSKDQTCSPPPRRPPDTGYHYADSLIRLGSEGDYWNGCSVRAI